MQPSQNPVFLKLDRSLDQYLHTRRRTEYEIAVLTSLTGKWAKGGQLTKRGYDFWQRRVNSRGGIRIGKTFHQVRLVYFDTQSRPSFARQLATELFSRERFDFIFGPYSSEETLSIAPAIEEFEIPHVTGSAESEEILTSGFSWTFGVLLCSSSGVTTPLRFLKTRTSLNIQTVAILSGDDAFSRSTSTAFQRAARHLELTLCGNLLYSSDLQSLDDYVLCVSNLQPDVVVVCGHIDNLINVVRAAKAIRFFPKAYVMHYGVASQDFVDALGSDARGILGFSCWSPESDYRDDIFGRARSFQEDFVREYGRSPDHTEAGCAATGVIFQTSVQQHMLPPPLRLRDQKHLRSVLAEDSFETFFGPIRFRRSAD